MASVPNMKMYLTNSGFTVGDLTDDLKKISFTCSKNHTSTLTVTSLANAKMKYKDNPLNICSGCRNVKGETSKITTERYLNNIKDSGITLTSYDEKTGKCTYNCINCGEHNETIIKTLSFKKSVFCNSCVQDKNKNNIYTVNKRIEPMGFKCIKYEGNKNLTMKCLKLGHEFSTLSLYDIESGKKGCPGCAPTKRAETNIEKYGADNVFKSELIKNKIKETHMKNYGVSHHMKVPEIKQQMIDTNMKKYGVPYAFNMEKVYEKIKAIHLKNYGVEYPLQSDEIQEKIKKAFIEKLGVEYPMLDQNYWKKVIFEKYGTEFPMQNEEIFNKAMSSLYRTKPFVFPSGNVVMVQGYEKYALKELVHTHQIDEKYISVKNMPEFWYIFNDQRRRYYPDIMVTTNVKPYFIEVKSIYTYKQNNEQVLEKLKCVNKSGYEIFVWIFDKKGEKVEELDGRQFRQFIILGK